MDEANLLCFRAKMAISLAHKYPSDKSLEKAKEALNRVYEFMATQDRLMRGALEVRLERPEYSLYVQIAELCPSVGEEIPLATAQPLINASPIGSYF
jgi:hypothetical protein